MSLQSSDAQAAAVATAPRVSLADIEDAIAGEIYVTGAEAFGASPHERLAVLTLCALTMKNGFVVIGQTMPVANANFNRDLGRKFAREDAVRQLWPLMGFALREKLAAS